MGRYDSTEKETISRQTKTGYCFLMNSLVIVSKLESLRRCLDRITSKKPESLDQLLEDIDMQDILALNLERSI